MSLPSQRFFRSTPRLKGSSPSSRARDSLDEPSAGLRLHFLTAKESLMREVDTVPGFTHRVSSNYGVLSLSSKLLKSRDPDLRAKAFVILYNYSIIHLYNRLQKQFAKMNSHSISFDEAFNRSWDGAFEVLSNVVSKRKLGVNFIGNLNHLANLAFVPIREKTNASSFLRRRKEPNLDLLHFIETEHAKKLFSHASNFMDEYVIRRRLGLDGHPEKAIDLSKEMGVSRIRISERYARGLKKIVPHLNRDAVRGKKSAIKKPAPKRSRVRPR